MEEIIIRSSDTDPEAVLVFRAAASVYANWCREHALKAVPVATMKVTGESYTLYGADGDALPGGEVDALRPVLGLQPGPRNPEGH